ncbi:CehA/McbA family metallohydrolase [Clostridium polynesiense]|uniref:CehA/McbA family metallohydrolase n=1 Tax=Clostridium polynesiense TaxID=1325933 RepID=UPI0006936E63|nr:CehA/McbA family metallohydrolase [Clostridium polynesiense]
MSRLKKFKFMYFVVVLTFLFANASFPKNIKKVFAQDGAGTWESPFSVTQAIGVQDGSIKTVQGYIVGQPTSPTTVIFSGFTENTALAVAESQSEKDINKMLFIQLPSGSVRDNFGLKNNPSKLGVLVKATGALQPYFTPHAGLKSTSKMEVVSENTTVPVTGIILDKTAVGVNSGANVQINASVLPENASNKKVSWSSDNPDIAAVNNGIITGVSEGNTVVKVSTEDGCFTASCSVKVNPYADTIGPDIKNVSPQSGEYTGDNAKPLISAEYSDKSGIDAESIKLFMDNTEVTSKATVTESNISYTPAEALSQGQHIVKLEVSDKSAAANKTVYSWNFFVGVQSYNFYFGQLHSHTNYSDGQGTPEEAFKWAKETAKADFFAVTDHSNSLDNDVSATILDGSSSTEWKNLHITADKYNETGKFAAIAGYEMTWSGSTGGWGHLNTFNTEGFLSRNSKIGGKAIDLPMYYNELKKVPQSISQFNHPGPTFGDFADFGYYDPQVDKVVTLIEVGNGEGAVRGSGYFPSYGEYTRALDKGWHLAPTNNQDNHKGNWVTANTARTVVLAGDLTRESVYDALRNMRTYASEDNNLRIMYKVNNQVMGSFLSNPSALDVNIQITDPDLKDNIGKVSIISNGGVVVASKEFTSNTAEWNLKLNPDYSYYYLRVDQADKDIAVTAPVWTGQPQMMAGISKVSTDQNIYTLNSPIKMNTVLYNNGSNSIENLKVEYFYNNIVPENKIGEQIIQSIPASGTADTNFVWSPEKTGSYTLYARVLINVNGEEKSSIESTKVEVFHSQDVVKVVMDAGHYNQYVSGDYAGKMTMLKSMLGEMKFMLIENNDEITAEDLKDAKILILTDPQSKDNSKYKLLKSLYTDNEVQVIKDFVSSGNSLIITSRADYDDKGVTEKIYESSMQGNKVLEAIGSNLRFNDDEIIDKTTNGGQEFRLYFNRFTSSKYNLTRNIPEGLTYSAYSGCSVILKDNGDEGKVEWLVKGHETTETLDSDLQKDAVPVEKGNVASLAAEILPGGGKVVVSGTTFFSDFETAGDNLYANKQIADNILNWAVMPAKKTIGEVRADEDKDGKPDLLGKGRVMVEGRVTAASKAAVKNTAFFDVAYIQDDTGGITVFGVSSKALPLGSYVRVTGIIDEYDGDTEIQISNEDRDIELIDDSISLIEPKEIATGDSMLEISEGLLLKIKGEVKRATDNSLYIDDGSGEARVYINGYIGDDTDNEEMLGKWDKNIKVGDTVSAVGLASQDAEGHRIRVRNTSEILKITIPLQGITLNKEKLTLLPGGSEELLVSFQPENATNKNILWSSSDTTIVSVDEKGMVTANKTGSAIITAISEDGGF